MLLIVSDLFFPAARHFSYGALHRAGISVRVQHDFAAHVSRRASAYLYKGRFASQEAFVVRAENRDLAVRRANLINEMVKFETAPL